MDEAAGNGHLDIVKWLNSNRKEGCSIRAMNHAALNGHLDVVKWLHETHVGNCTNSAMDNAAKNGHLEIVKFLHHNRKEGCRCVSVGGVAGSLDGVGGVALDDSGKAAVVGCCVDHGGGPGVVAG